MLRFAFKLFDLDHDGKLSERDLFEPIMAFNDQLYIDVYVLDLPRILKPLSLKLRPNAGKQCQTKEVGQKRNVPASDFEVVIAESDALTFKEFAVIFDQYYPALIVDILECVTKFSLPLKPPVETKKPAGEDDDPKQDYWADGETRTKVEFLLENRAPGDKVCNAFKQLAENPNKGESKMYLTLYSLTRGFVSSHGFMTPK